MLTWLFLIKLISILLLVYQKDTDLIPKNSRVRINRVLKSIGPAIAGGVTTSTQKQKEEELVSNLREKFNAYSNAYSSPSASPVNDFSEKQNTDNESSIYSDIMANDESNSNSSLSMPFSELNGIHPGLNTTDISPLVTSEEKAVSGLLVYNRTNCSKNKYFK